MSQFESKFKHGQYSFSISVENFESIEIKNRIQKAVKEQFSSFLPSDQKGEKLKFYLCENAESFFPYRNYRNIGNVKYKDESLYYNQHGIKFVAKKIDEQYNVYFEIQTKSDIKSRCRLLNKGFNNAFETQISIFYYRVFIIFTQLANIDLQSTYIHGATICDKSVNAILFPADSGVGKSSMLFRMAQEQKYSYIADDLSIVSESGESFYAGRAISTKPYHLKNFPFLNEFIEKEMPMLQRLQWKFLKDNRLVFRVNPQKLFRGNVKEKAKVRKIVHLVNTDNTQFTLKKFDTDRLALASANILMNELILGNQIIYKALSIPGNTLFESPGNMFKKILEIYKSFFEGSEKYLLEVPYMSHPDKMYEYLVKNNIID